MLNKILIANKTYLINLVYHKYHQASQAAQKTGNAYVLHLYIKLWMNLLVHMHTKEK